MSDGDGSIHKCGMPAKRKLNDENDENDGRLQPKHD